MRRVQLIEIHDQPWFPAFLRDLVTDDLQTLLSIGKPYGDILPQLREGIERAGADRVLDLCSGAGVPWPWLADPLRPRALGRAGWKVVWTWLIPIVPVVLLFDGIVSCLRVYSPGELRELTCGLADDGYRWEIGCVKRGFLRLPITFLVGYPEKSPALRRSGSPKDARETADPSSFARMKTYGRISS